MFSQSPESKSARKQRLREAHKRWLAGVAARRGQSLTALAKDIGNDQSMLTRFMNDDERGSTLDTLTIAALVEITGEEPPGDIIGASEAPVQRTPGSARNPGLRETEAAPYIAAPEDPIAGIIRLLTGESLHRAAFELKSRALEGEGYLPGDILIVDLNLEARSDDIVCAQFYDWKNPGATQTVFRLYDKPWLLASGPREEGRKPRLVDGESVIIKGVLVDMFRPVRRDRAKDR